jgi:hypothetical protein
MKKNLKEMLNKANELRALFVFGQRVIPFLEEIFIFVNDIEPLLEEINVSIAENLKKMPTASNQLSKVTEATELATTEIMDILDNLSFKTDVIARNLNTMREIKDIQNQSVSKLLDILHKAIQSGENLNDYLPEISGILSLIKESQSDKFDITISETKSILDSINLDSGSIMMSLQVQDITSQQLAAVNHLIGAVQDKLIKIIEKFETTNIDTLMSQEEKVSSNSNVSKMHRAIAFDPDAVKTTAEKDQMQSSVDDLINLHKAENEGNEVHESASQEAANEFFSGDFDIEALQNEIEQELANQNNSSTDNDSEDVANEVFQDQNLKENGTSTEDSIIPDVEMDSLDEPFSQDDIDALFK